MRDKEFSLLSPEEKEQVIKKRSQRRLLMALLFTIGILAIYIVYSVVRLFICLA